VKEGLAMGTICCICHEVVEVIQDDDCQVANHVVVMGNRYCEQCLGQAWNTIEYLVKQTLPPLSQWPSHFGRN
jgi:hypothetical protein